MFFSMLFVRIIVSIKKKSLEKIKKYHTMSCEGILMADRKIFSRLVMIWMLLPLLVLLSCTEKESIEKHPVFGRDKIETGHAVEDCVPVPDDLNAPVAGAADTHILAD